MLNKNNVAKITALKNEIVEVSTENKKDKILEQCMQALLERKEQIKFSYEEDGIQYEDEYNQFEMIDYLSGYSYIQVAEFINKPNEKNFNSLLNGYFLELLYYISAKENNEEISDGFDSDIVLSLLFAMLYCDSNIQSQMMNCLEYYKFNMSKRDDVCWFFSTSTILPLAYNFYKKVDNSSPWTMVLENVVNKDRISVNEEIMLNISSLYKNVITHLYTDNMSLLQELIGDMCQYHIDNSQGNYLLEFNGDLQEYFPVEVLFVLKQRVNNGLSIAGIHHELIDDFLPYFLNDFDISAENRLILELIFNK